MKRLGETREIGSVVVVAAGEGMLIQWWLRRLIHVVVVEGSERVCNERARDPAIWQAED